MSAIAVKGQIASDDHAALPLYGASLVVTLAGIGAVGMTLFAGVWLPLWAGLAILGHIVSYALRRAGVSLNTILLPVLGLGSLVTLQQLISGGPLAGLGMNLFSLTPDLATAVVMACLATVRCFTLVTNGTLLFSPVPSITMLALSASSNPNAEIPVFFALVLLGALFITGYEAHLRRAALARRAPAPIVFHLAGAWAIVLVLSGVSLLFPFLLQPVLGQFSPYAVRVARLRSLLSFTQVNTNQAPVGAGPIQLSPAPVYEVYTSEPGRLRTSVFTRYGGRGWSTEFPPHISELESNTRVPVRPADPDSSVSTYYHYAFQIPPESGTREAIPTRQVVQGIQTVGYASQGIPAFGRIRTLRYPKSTVTLHGSGCISGGGHGTDGRYVEVVSDVKEIPEARLRAAKPVGAGQFRLLDTETLSLPQSTARVQELAKQITAGITSPYGQIQALISYIEKNCTYSLMEEVTPAGEDAVDYYLFTTKRGACDLAASALAIMCRSVGIPARVAVGYVADEPLPQGGGFLVRQEDAHMWVETYFEEFGWVPFDPAPPISTLRQNGFQAAWNRVRNLFATIGGGGMDALLLVMVVAVTVALALVRLSRRGRDWLARQMQRRALLVTPSQKVVAHYGNAVDLLGRRGWAREPWMTASEYLEHLRRQWPENPGALEALETLTESFQRAHYGGEASEADLRQTEAALAVLKREVPRRRRPRAGRAIACAPEQAGGAA